VQVDPVALELKLVDLAFAVVLAVMLFVVPGLVLAGWRRQRQ
jgi:Ca2+/H+ antiporter